MATLTMKERFARLDLSKLSGDLKGQFTTIDESTEHFSDEDLNKVFEEEFDENYKLVEQYYPDAIKKGGTIKKEKPVKVKKVRAKKTGNVTDKEWLTKEAKEEYHKRAEQYKLKNERRKLSKKDIADIESTIWEANWGNKQHRESNEALVATLMHDFDISRSQAEKWTAKRDNYKEDHKYDDYSGRTEKKKGERKSKDPNNVKTRDGYEFNRKDPSLKGEKFFDENGKQWTCKGYNAKLDECVMADSEGKEISTCLKDMYVHNPVSKREKGNLVDECRETLKEAGYTVKVHKAGKKKVSRKEPRPEKEIVKEKVENTFTTITKDLVKSEDSQKENKEVIDALGRIEKLFVKVMNRISNLADDGKAEKLEKIEKLLRELVED